MLDNKYAISNRSKKKKKKTQHRINASKTLKKMSWNSKIYPICGTCQMLVQIDDLFCANCVSCIRKLSCIDCTCFGGVQCAVH